MSLETAPISRTRPPSTHSSLPSADRDHPAPPADRKSRRSACGRWRCRGCRRQWRDGSAPPDGAPSQGSACIRQSGNPVRRWGNGPAGAWPACGRSWRPARWPRAGPGRSPRRAPRPFRWCGWPGWRRPMPGSGRRRRWRCARRQPCPRHRLPSGPGRPARRPDPLALSRWLAWTAQSASSAPCPDRR